MVQFISAPQPKPKSVASQLLEGAAEGALSGYQTYLMQKERSRLLAKEQKQEEEAIAKEMKRAEAYEKLGLPSDVDPQIAKEILKQKAEDKRLQDLYDQLGLKKSTAQQQLGTVPQAQGMPQALGQPTPQAKLGEPEPDTAWMDAVGLPEQDRAKAPEAMSAWERMSDEQRAAIAIQEPQLARILEQGREFNQRQDLQRKEFLFKTAQAKKKEELEKVRHEEELDLKSYANNADYREKILSGFEAYERDKAILGNMEQIAEKENLPTPLMSGLLEKTGLPIGILQNPDAEQFEKLSQELVKNITGTYGNRILLAEVQSFMKSIPTLMNSPEGKKKLIRQWKILNEGKRVYYDAYERIRERNPKRLPPDLHEQVLKESRADLDRLAEEFKNLSRPFTRKKVDPGTRITNDIVDNYLELSNNDPNIARKLAAEDGYEF